MPPVAKKAPALPPEGPAAGLQALRAARKAPAAALSGPGPVSRRAARGAFCASVRKNGARFTFLERGQIHFAFQRNVGGFSQGQRA